MIFKPTDFSDCYKWNDNFGSPVDAIAHQANKLFNEWLDKQPVVYGYDEVGWGDERLDNDTHRARLVCIEPIVQEHECWPVEVNTFEKATLGYGWTTQCKICGAELRATWSKK